MSQADHATNKQANRSQSDNTAELRKSPMMAHLLDALEKQEDIGHYGRLTFAMIARHFLSDDEIVDLLSHQPDHNATDSRALLQQVKQRNYNPPKRERILEWQAQQDFPICPDPENPDACNVYQELNFPPDIFDQINNYHEEQVKAEEKQNS
ncbi:hypothetical protein [Dictyobacter aurantiacus]|uniref:Uncharacterized protein n=1 Tax=Dictyobacter aurantiacus TaxID=1936993 RepID=A0A401ZMT4_9CHLR|nr:hypothetical protein [Dictyobacter aurantiacus]GCE08163.1 hypothetical protein KDAU_54920 [Dictyobacter aurantiacus]